jgi:hypothetical protein
VGDGEADVDRAADFLWRHGRLLERLLFANRFLGAPAEPVVHALRAYQNDDGGFGHALEPDVRAPDSQPIHVDMALRVLHEIDVAPPEMVARACSYLTSMSSEAGGVPAITAVSSRYPHGEHWQPHVWIADSVNPTAMITGLLHSLHFGHAWLERADAFCWNKISDTKVEDGPALAAVFCFLNNAPDRRRAVPMAEEMADAIPNATFFALDPEDVGSDYALTPLHLAPTRDAMAAGLFAPELLDAHLDHLASRQQPDGGWPITWEAPTDAAALEWRGRVTLEALIRLQDYGRI